MAEEIGGINVKISADTSGLDKGAAKAKESLSGIDDKAKKASSSTKKLSSSSNELGSNLGKVAVAAFAAAGGIAAIVSTTSKIAAFDDAMLGLKATISGTDEQMARLEKQSRSLGASTIYSAEQTANAQRFLAQAGFDVNEVLAATPGILELATAGNMGLAESADLASNVLGGFSLEIEELGRVNDVLAATASSSNTSVQQLGIAMSYVAPMAKSAGISIEETAAAIGVLSDAGIQGSRAGTNFTAFIRQMSKITPQAEAALDKYGIKIGDVDIKSRGLQSVLETLKDAGIEGGDAFTIFGSEANAAAEIMATASVRVETLTDKFNKANGSAKKMSDTMASGVSASLKGFVSASEEVILVLGDQGGKSGIIGLSSVATEIMRDLGMALDYAGSESGGTAEEFKIFDEVMRGVAISTKVAYEVVDSMVSSISMLGTMIALVASGEFGLMGEAWDNYNEKIKENIAQTEYFYGALYQTKEWVAIKEANEELDAMLDKAASAENALNNLGENDSSDVKSKGNGGKNKSEGESNAVSAQREKIKLLEEEWNWKKELAVFDGEGIIEANAERELEASQAKLDAVKEYFQSDLDILIEANEARQYAIDEALINEQISAEDHEQLMSKIAKDGAKARSKLAETERSGKINIAKNMFGTLSTLMNTSNKQMFEIGKKAALANAAIDGAQSVMSAFRSGMETGGPWAPLVAAGYAAVAGINAANLIGNISSQSFGGGGSPSVPTMATAQPAAPSSSVPSGGGQPAQSSGTLTVQGLTAGSLISGDVVAEIAEQLLDYQAAGGNVVLR